MINNLKKRSRAVTLVELMIAVFLLGLVVLTAVSLELALRKMQIGPTAKTQLLNELTPVMKKIRKDYDRQIGEVGNTSVNITNNGKTLGIRVDDSSPYGRLNPGDSWMVYRWNGTQGDPIEYYNLSNPGSVRRLAGGIFKFKVISPTSHPDEAITVDIRKRKDASQDICPVSNPQLNLTTTIFSRGASLR